MIYRFTEVLNDLVNYFLLGDILLLEDWKQANHLSDDLAMEFTTNESGDRVFAEGIVIPMAGIEKLSLKSNRCTTDNCVVHSENKEVIYTVRCAECGDRLIHRTDNSRKNTESWYCKNKDCKTVIRKTVAVLEDEITELLNSVIQNPDLAGKEYISSKNETPIEIKRMENEIERALGQIDFDKETIQNLILQCASKRYEKEKSQKHITDRLKADFEKSSPLSVFDAEFFSKTVTAVLLTKNGSVSLLLKNGNIIGKEKNKDVNASSDNA